MPACRRRGRCNEVSHWVQRLGRCTPACHSPTTRFPTSPERRAARPALALARPGTAHAEAFAARGRILVDLHPESYIYVQDVRAEAYGYGGLNQEYRYIKAQP